jgi:hypothetical protein
MVCNQTFTLLGGFVHHIDKKACKSSKPALESIGERVAHRKETATVHQSAGYGQAHGGKAQTQRPSSSAQIQQPSPPARFDGNDLISFSETSQIFHAPWSVPSQNIVKRMQEHHKTAKITAGIHALQQGSGELVLSPFDPDNPMFRAPDFFDPNILPSGRYKCPHLGCG